MACCAMRLWGPNSSSYPVATTLDRESVLEHDFHPSECFAPTYPFLIPHSPTLFHPSLVTSRSRAYLAPHTFRVLTYGGCFSASEMYSLIRGETASSPNFSRRGHNFSRTEAGRYHWRIRRYAGSEVAGLGRRGGERMKPVDIVEGVGWVD